MGNSLRWKALWFVDWVSVNGETDGDAEGMGDGRVSIGIVHGEGTRETSSTTVTFYYFDDETGEEVGRKEVKVCRCICGCEQLEFWPEPCNCDMLDFWPEPCNCEDFEVLDVEVVDDCDCDDFEIDTSPLYWEWNDDATKTKEVLFTKNCIKSAITTGVTNNHFNVELTDYSIIINPTGTNTEATPFEGKLTINYSSALDPDCLKEIILTHKVSDCQCGVLTTSQESASWVWNSVTERTIDVDATDECIDISSIDVTITGASRDHFNLVTPSFDDTRIGTITVNPTGTNDSSTDTLTADIVISYKSGSNPSCDKKVKLTHKNSNCQCGILTASPGSETWVWNSVVGKTITVDATNECIDFSSISVAITGNNSSHFTASSSFTESTKTGTITVSPTGMNDSTTDTLTADVVITYKSGSNPSCTEKITLTHDNMVCDCDNFEVTDVINPFNNN